jgi:hypothetical protein
MIAIPRPWLSTRDEIGVNAEFVALEYIGILMAACFAYRSARSLAPLNRLSLDEIQSRKEPFQQ